MRSVLLNVKELLEDFGLEDNKDNVALVRLNLNILNYQQDLYKLHTLYPSLHTMRRWTYQLEPIILEPPPLNLNKIVYHSPHVYINLQYAYDYLIAPKNPVGCEPTSIVSFFLKLDSLLNTGLPHLMKNADSMYMIDDELWFEDRQHTAPLHWWFRRYPHDYNLLKANFFLKAKR